MKRCLLVIFSLLLASIAGLGSRETPARAAEAPVTPIKVVLIGDSYAAGNGSRTVTGDRSYYGPEGCLRSSTNWTEKYVAWLRTQNYAVTLINRACSGATTEQLLSPVRGDEDDFVEAFVPAFSEPDDPAVAEAIKARCFPSQYPDEEYFTVENISVGPDVSGGSQYIAIGTCVRWLRAQLDAIGPDTDLVLLTIGGNDVGFGNIVKQCLVTGLRDPSDCESKIQVANQLAPGMGNQLERVFDGMRTRGLRDDARAVLLSYPYLNPDDDFTLKDGGVQGQPIKEFNAADGIRALGDLGDSIQSAAVTSANAAHPGQITFLNTVKAGFATHEPWAEGTNPDPYMFDAFDTQIAVEWYHPNPAGHEEYASLLKQGGTYQAGTDAAPDNDIDIALTIDTTGSMASSIDQVKQDAVSLVDAVSARTNSARFAVVAYKDQGDESVSRVLQPFTDDAVAVKNAVTGIVVGGGGDTPESMYSGLMTSIALPWRPGVKKMALVLADAPPHDPEPGTGLTAQDVVDAAYAVDPAQVYLADTGAAASPEVTQLVQDTGGSVFPVGSDVTASLLDAIDDALAKPYAWAGGPYVTKVGQAVTFDASGSYATEGTLSSFDWDFDGDGTYDRTTTVPTTTHTWNAPFAGALAVRVTDTSGRSNVGTAHASATTDGDEVGADDNCPDVSNADQTDYDADGVGDACDSTPGYPTEDKPGVTVSRGTSDGLFISQSEVMALPMSGPEWNHVRAVADSAWGPATMTNQSSLTMNKVFAGALVYARTGDATYKTKVIDKIKEVAVAGPLDSLAMFRQMGSYVRAAVLVGMPKDTVVASGETWGEWATRMMTDPVGDHHKWDSVEHGAYAPNTYGAYARDAYVSLALYNDDSDRLLNAYKITARWLGDLQFPNPFEKPTNEAMANGWYCATDFDTTAPAHYLAVQGVINPANCEASKAGVNVEGASPGGPPPTITGDGLDSQLAALDGTLAAAIMLSRHGYPEIWMAGDRAFKRNAVRINANASASTWPALFRNIPHIVNDLYGTSLPEAATQTGRSLGFTDWLGLNDSWLPST